MVQALALVLPFQGAISVAGVALTTASGALTVAGSLLNAAAGLAISAALAPRPEAPPIQDQQRTLQQDTGPRIRHVGKVRVAGTRVFLRSKEGFVYQILVHGAGGPYRIDGIQVENEPVTLDENGYATDERFQQGGRSLLRILTRTGQDPSPYYEELNAVFPEWTQNHRLDGLCTSLMIREQGRANEYSNTWPSDPPTVSLELHGPAVLDPRDGQTKFTANASLQLADFAERHLGLAGLIDQEFLRAAADVDDELVATPEGQEARWELNGSYSLTEDPRSVFRQWLEAYGMDVRFLPTGRMAILPGQYEEPTVVYTRDDVEAVERLNNGPGQMEIYTRLPWTYVDRDLNYLATSGARYIDEEAEAQLGRSYVSRETAALEVAGTHWRGQRAAKVRTRRDNPSRRLVLRMRERAIRGHLERCVRLDLFPENVAGVYRVKSSGLDERTGKITQVLEAADPTAYDFPVNDYKPRQELPPDQEESVIPALAGFNAAAEGVQTAQNALAAGIRIVWTGPNPTPYIPYVQVAVAGSGEWGTPLPANEDTTTIFFGPAPDGAAFDVRGAYQTVAGDFGAFTTVTNVVARAATTTPQPPSAISVPGAATGPVSITLTTWNDTSLWQTAIQRDGVEVTRFDSARGEEIIVEDDPGPGTYEYTATSINVSDAESVPTAGQTVTIT